MNERSKNGVVPHCKRRSFRRLHNPAKARSDDVYSIRETASLHNVEEQTVRNWLKEGLETVVGATRILIRGAALNAFHAARNERARRPMTETQFLCLRCRMPREPALGSVIGATHEAPSLRLEARCGICDGAMFRAWSRSAAAALQARSNLCAVLPEIVPEAPSDVSEHLSETRQIETNCDSVIQRSTIAARDTSQTPEGPLNTNELNQFSLPFGF